MDQGYQIKSERLVLRSFHQDDLEQHINILANWEVTRWLSTNIPFPYTREDGIEFIKNNIDNYIKADQFCFSVNIAETDQHIGGVKVFSYKSEECEVGYWLSQDSWGKGYGAEILSLACEWIFNQGYTKRIIAQTAKDNVGSRKILDKVGFEHRGIPPKEHSRCGHGQGCSEFYILERSD